MARIGEYRDETRVRIAREALAKKLHSLNGYVGGDLAEAIERLIEEKIADSLDRRY